MESFFGTRKTELAYQVEYHTRNQAKASILEYVETFYNRTRLQEKLGYLSPELFKNFPFQRNSLSGRACGVQLHQCRLYGQLRQNAPGYGVPHRLPQSGDSSRYVFGIVASEAGTSAFD